MKIRPYQATDEIEWLRCRVLAFLDTAYYDNVLNKKETYEHVSIELVAEIDGQIVGLIDVEIEDSPHTVCSDPSTRSAMIWHIAVHPDYRRHGLGNQLLKAVEERLIEKGITRIEAWTRDDDWVLKWYVRNGFVKKETYLHVYMDGSEELKGNISSLKDSLFPVYVFSHYTGEDLDEMKGKFKRVHECSMFERRF